MPGPVCRIACSWEYSLSKRSLGNPAVRKSGKNGSEMLKFYSCGRCAFTQDFHGILVSKVIRTPDRIKGMSFPGIVGCGIP